MNKKPKHITSSGREIDFNLIAAKQEISSNPTPTQVQERQNKINARLRRRQNSAASMEKQQHKKLEKMKNADDELMDDGNDIAVENDSNVEPPKKSNRRQKAKPIIKKSTRDSEDSDETN